MTSTAPKKFVFVLMPFDKAFDDTYNLAIKPACIGAGAYCERLDEQIFVENMLDRIYSQISKADLIISDMTGRNANVFYETGYAHALNKIVIALTKDAIDIPFDLKHFPHIIYGNSLTRLRDDLLPKVQHFLAAPPKYLVRNDLEFLINGQPVGNGGEVDIIATELGIVGVYLSVRNRASAFIHIDIMKTAIYIKKADWPFEIKEKEACVRYAGSCAGVPYIVELDEMMLVSTVEDWSNRRLLPKEIIGGIGGFIVGYFGEEYRMPIKIRSFYPDCVDDILLTLAVKGKFKCGRSE